MTLLRLRVLISGLWVGLVLCVAAVAAPSAFAVLPRADAGLVVAKVFALEAGISLALGLLLILMDRRLTRDQPKVITAELLLAALALFCTIAGYYGLQPQMQAARAGQGALSFGALHAISSGFFAIKGLALLALAWRSSALRSQEV